MKLLEKKQQKYKIYNLVIKHKLIWSFVCLALISCGNSTYDSQEYISTNLTEEKINLSNEVFKKLKKEHYIKNFVKDDFNIRYINALIDRLDGNKLYFIESEITNFKEESNQYLGNSFDIDLAYLIINLYFERLVAFSEYQIKLIEKNSFDFTKDEFIDIYYEDNQWAESEALLKEIWRNETKNDLLVALMSETLSDDANKVLLKRYKNRIKRIQQQKEEDIFSIAINTLTNQFDPHSSYLSPRSAEDFDMNMSLKLEGIGALLGADDDYTKIVSLVPGGPAEKSGEILPEDKITRIRQINTENNEYIDVVGWRIDEVVDLIRGESGTQVEIEFISSDSADNSRKLVTLTREEIKLEDRAAKSKIIETEDGNKIGIIDLPSFYIDFNAYQNRDSNYRSSSNDVEDILINFNKEDVDAVILDLRNNGGGALIEANKIVGLFVSSGPTVQVKHKAGYIQPYGSSKAKQTWQKPMGVLVNRYSASASEIVAGAIQDYKRGIVLGQRTFGKGTVQSLESISKGQVKITESKYYRVDGSSTQNKGVLPDIELLSTWDIESVGESSYPTALEWDTVRPYRHKKFNFDSNQIIEIKNLYSQRLNSSPNLKYLGEVRDRYYLNKDKKLLSLNLDTRKLEKDARKNWLLQIENKRRESLGLEIFGTYEDLEESNKKNENTNNDIDYERDYLLIESTNIINDYLNLNKLLISKVNKL
ncbi:MAG: peptidase [Proteobacteria bacterium]|nr:peptidase [Pseudomonadota bacterium]NCX30154.1 peptidase [Pseudomonadota bacterium]